MKTIVISLIFFAIFTQTQSSPLMDIFESIKPAKEMISKIVKGGRVEGNSLADTIQNSMDRIVSQMTPIISKFRETSQVGMKEITDIVGDPRSIFKAFMGGMRSKRQTDNESTNSNSNSNQKGRGRDNGKNNKNKNKGGKPEQSNGNNN